MGLLSGDQTTRPFNAPCTSTTCDPGSLVNSKNTAIFLAITLSITITTFNGPPLCGSNCFSTILLRWMSLVRGELQEQVLAKRKPSSPPAPTWARLICFTWTISDFDYWYTIAQIPEVQKWSLLCQVVYTVGAVAAAYELYSSLTKATELTKRLQRLKDSSGQNLTFPPHITLVLGITF